MTVKPGRLLRASDALEQSSRAAPTGAPSLPRGRRVPKPVVDAADEARRILADAEHRARTLTEAAARAAADVRLRAEAEGRADGVAAIAARALALSAHEASGDERALDRSVALARILAERLLGEALGLDPSRVTALARQALSEARGARRARLLAHPEDVPLLERALSTLGESLDAIEVAADPERERGGIRIETEIGVLDGALAPQLDRLAQKLRDSMSS